MKTLAAPSGVDAQYYKSGHTCAVIYGQLY